MANELTIRYVPITDAREWVWVDNPKQHDDAALIRSIERYGFQEPPKFNATLPNESDGTGAFTSGNGRVTAVYTMYMRQMDRPDGIREDDDGVWLIPVNFGNDLPEDMAAAYAVDANNLTVMGGDFTADDVARMWDRDGYERVLAGLKDAGELPVTVDEHDVAALFEKMDGVGPMVESTEFEIPDTEFDVTVTVSRPDERDRIVELLEEHGYVPAVATRKI